MENQELSPRTQRIIEHLEHTWQQPQPLPPSLLRKITESVMGLPEPYRTVGIECVARRVVNDMCLHMLALIATFQEQAEQEDISQEDRKEALEHILPQIFQVLEDLNQYISVQSLDDLATLSSITASLWVLSETEMAEEARSRLYELPETYHQELAQENLLIDTSLIPDETRAPSQKRPIIFLRKDA